MSWPAASPTRTVSGCWRATVCAISCEEVGEMNCCARLTGRWTQDHVSDHQEGYMHQQLSTASAHHTVPMRNSPSYDAPTHGLASGTDTFWSVTVVTKHEQEVVKRSRQPLRVQIWL